MKKLLLALALAPCLAAGQEELLTPYNTGFLIRKTVSNPALLSLDATSHDYGNKAAGTAATDFTITVSAVAAKATASIGISSSPAAPFQFTGGYPGTGGTCGTTLAAGATCTIVLSYAPPAAGVPSVDSGNFTFYWDDGNGGHSQGFTATGYAYPNVALFASFRTPGCYATLTAETGQSISLLRSTSGTYTTKGPGVAGDSVVTCPANQLRVGANGLLAESAATNALTYSEQLDNAAWATSNVTVGTPNAGVAPDANTTAETVTSTVNGGYIQSSTLSAAGSTNYIVSIWVWTTSGSQPVTLALRDDTSGTDFCTSNWTATTQYTRIYCRSAGETAAHSIRLRLYPGGTGGTGAVYAWGGQLEAWAGTQPTSYFATTAAGATRAADLTINAGAVTLGSTWSIAADAVMGVVTTTQALAEPYKDASNWIELYLSSVHPQTDMRIAGATVSENSGVTPTTMTSFHWRGLYDGTDLWSCKDATCVHAAQSNTSLVTAWTAFYIGNNQANSHAYRGASGGIKNLCAAATSTGCT